MRCSRFISSALPPAGTVIRLKWIGSSSVAGERPLFPRVTKTTLPSSRIRESLRGCRIRIRSSHGRTIQAVDGGITGRSGCQARSGPFTASGWDHLPVRVTCWSISNLTPGSEAGRSYQYRKGPYEKGIFLVPVRARPRKRPQYSGGRGRKSRFFLVNRRKTGGRPMPEEWCLPESSACFSGIAQKSPEMVQRSSIMRRCTAQPPLCRLYTYTPLATGRPY